MMCDKTLQTKHMMLHRPRYFKMTFPLVYTDWKWLQFAGYPHYFNNKMHWLGLGIFLVEKHFFSVQCLVWAHACVCVCVCVCCMYTCDMCVYVCQCVGMCLCYCMTHTHTHTHQWHRYIKFHCCVVFSTLLFTSHTAVLCMCDYTAAAK